MLARRVQHLKSTGAFEFLAKAAALEKQGKDIIHLEIGQPDFDTPINIKEAGIKAIKDGYTKYTDGQGLPKLREVIAEHVSKTRGIKVEPDEVVITQGASPIIFFVILALIEEGDEVLYPNPGFFTYEPVTILADGIPVPIHLIEEKCFTMDVDEIRRKISNRTKLVIINSPHNPTGGMLSPEDLKEIANIVRKRNCLVLSDEVYSEMVYDGEFHSIASCPDMKDKTIIVDSFSKTYAMTGWRLGYGVMRKDLADKVAALQINSNSCVTGFIQIAGIEAIRGSQEEVRARCKIFKKRRDLIIDGLNKIKGIKCVKPKGAFYAFANHKELDINSRELAEHLLNEAGVACLPGTVFGEFGEGYVRFTYANSEENIERALKRIEQAIAKLARA
ncbi:MAG TPA: pyridoxal phosphate-dependent aminotransferase [bacterium (Candidatus Stahlbacteria)]|nr:pyridoxal phosphate-dependent aminotransferase [Candidatus Stahlbacteria bacterium]